jgi:YidC/Oxa1 family membrane protein insertase
MEKRVLLAIVLMIAVIVGTNLLFPPTQPPPRQAGGAADTAARTGGGPAAVDTASPPDTAPAPAPRGTGLAEAGQQGAAGETEEDTAPDAARDTGRAAERGIFEDEETARPGDTVVVSGPLYSYRFSTRGASLVGATLEQYASYASDGAGDERVQLVREGDRYLGWSVTDGTDTLSLGDRIFETETREIRLEEGGGSRSLTFRYPVPGRAGLTFRVTYTFRPDSYVVGVEGAFEGLGQRGYTVLTSLGRGLRTNEANPDEDYGQLGFAVNAGEDEIHTTTLDDVEPGERRAAEGGPFPWVAVKNKYFLIAYVAPSESSGFGGLIAQGVEAEHAAELTASLPVPAGEPGFRMEAYVGPQEFDRLSAVGQNLQNVNPIGYDWLRFIIRPLANIITGVLTWMHGTLGLAYGWVLILFGIMMRVVLFPVYQKSMRAQMAQMQVQPLMKEIQDKYEDDPEKLQKEMIRLYKEHNINPLAGCLPMLLPFPILITLFFVFQNTIEFRGVPFLWISDLSLHDPFYVTPLVMGLSMFLMQWIGQRGMERNTQMKIMGYAMPVVFTVLFARFPAGLNLYYATSNLASLPQQFYLARERRQAQKKGKIATSD